MLISRIILKDFGRFDNLVADFSPGLNLIKGLNEAGKSTLAEAVTAALFVDPRLGPERIAGACKWGANHAPILEAVLNIEGTSYKLTKDFERGVGSIEPNKAGFPGGDTADIGSWLSEKLGMPSESVFKSTACVSQGEIDHIDDSIEAIKDKLESLATRGKEELAASSAIKKIKDRMKFIAGETEEGSRIRFLEEELAYNIEKLERDIAGLRGKRQDLIQVETAFLNVREDVRGRKQKLEFAEQAGAVAVRVAELLTETDGLRKQVSSAKDSVKKIDGLKSQRSGLKRISRSESDDVEQTESSLNNQRPKRSELEEDVREATEDLRVYKIGRLSIALTVLGFMGTSFLAACYFKPILPAIMPYFWHSLGVTAAFLALGVSVTFSRRQHKVYLTKKLKKYTAKLESLNAEIAEREGKLSLLLAHHSVSSAEELKKNRWKYEELEKQIETETALYNQAVAGNTLGSLEKRLEQLERESKDVSGENEKLSQYFLGGEDLQKQKLVINEIEERLKDLDREKTSLLQQIEMAEGGSELLASYVERRQRLKQNRDDLERESKILELTIQCIEEARQNVLLSKLEILNSRTSEILDGLTAGRYSKVRFDKSSLKFAVWSSEKEDWVDPEKWLSAGTVDQIYLAARLALADLISDEKNSILILDDPFANYDESRLENAMRVLKELSEEHQIFLLTSQNHYDKWADSTINL